MTIKRIRILILTATIGAFCAVLGAQLSLPGASGLASAAWASTNRNVSPVNVQSVARRSTGDCNAALMTVC